MAVGLLKIYRSEQTSRTGRHLRPEQCRVPRRGTAERS
jgi:hypothetical protein